MTPYGWSIEVPPRRMRTWHCERCGGTACEVSSDEGSIPTACPCGHEPEWREGRWYRESR